MSAVRNPAEAEFPHRYGTDDRLGAMNEITPDKVLQASKLVRHGKRYQLGQILDESSPAQMWRYWKHSLLVDRLIPDRFLGRNHQSFLEESVAGALHSGTHLDSLGHAGIGPYTYNGYRYSDIVSAQGLTMLGIDEVPPIFTRGVLLDIAAHKRVDCLDDSYAITADDLEAAAREQEVEIGGGDVLLVNTGWGKHWGTDNARYKASEPGLGMEAAAWCTDRRVAVIGADNWAVEVVPGEVEDMPFPVHQHCISLYGCYLLENVITAELVRDGVQEFCCVILPARLRGASASIVAPVAVV